MRRMDQRGVTIVELMVAMMLLTVALIALAASFPYAMYGVVAGGYQTTATLLAQQAMDQARNTLYSNLSTLNTTGGAGSCGGGTGTFVTVTGYTGFTRCVDMQAAASSTTVTVVVEFNAVGGIGTGTIYDTTLTTIITQ